MQELKKSLIEDFSWLRELKKILGRKCPFLKWVFLYVYYIFDMSISCLLRSNTTTHVSILLRSLKTQPIFILSISNFPCSGNAALFYQHYNHEKVRTGNWIWRTRKEWSQLARIVCRQHMLSFPRGWTNEDKWDPERNHARTSFKAQEYYRACVLYWGKQTHILLD